jgi:hypothetical protein
MLGIFEQGYYNQLGFGNGAYDHSCRFDPAQLLVSAEPRVPQRLSGDDGEAMHASRLRRHRIHGSCSIDSPQLTNADVLWSDNGFGLGYRDSDGRIDHHFWCSAKEPEHGPYRVLWMAYRTREQFHELLGLLRGLGDQVRSIELVEPPGIQFQDILRQPLKTHQITERSSFESRIAASAGWQVRILDLARCLSAVRLDAEPTRFNLSLNDPIERFLDPSAGWSGIAGDYTVVLGPESACAPGADPMLPTMTASVNAFSRMWLGVQSPSGIAWTDDLAAPAELLLRLDRTLRLPQPKPDWMF